MLTNVPEAPSAGITELTVGSEYTWKVRFPSTRSIPLKEACTIKAPTAFIVGGVLHCIWVELSTLAVVVVCVSSLNVHVACPRLSK